MYRFTFESWIHLAKQSHRPIQHVASRFGIDFIVHKQRPVANRILFPVVDTQKVNVVSNVSGS